MQLDIPEDIEASLQSRAKLAGYPNAEAYALSLLQPKEEDEDRACREADLSYEQWNERLDAYIARQRSTNPNFDDSRESIYSDRG